MANSDAIIAIGGDTGILSEIAHIWSLKSQVGYEENAEEDLAMAKDFEAAENKLYKNCDK